MYGCDWYHIEKSSKHKNKDKFLGNKEAWIILTVITVYLFEFVFEIFMSLPWRFLFTIETIVGIKYHIIFSSISKIIFKFNIDILSVGVV